MTDDIPTAAALVIGNEILSGRTADANLNAIATRLTAIGVPLREARVVPDIQSEIVAALNALRARYTYVFTTGGIGPTHDDITVDAVAAAFGVPVVEDPRARALLERYYGAEKLTPARLRMARAPVGADLIENPVSTAPGIKIGNVYVMAGVPNIMQAMMDGVVLTLRHGPAVHSLTISGFMAESAIAEDLGAIAARYPHIDIGSYPWVREGRFGTALVARGTDDVAVKAAAAEILALARAKDPAAAISAG
ncbi:MAG: competence/damage-inducible protein A [Alphaproteobacteria bacterium]|nr:competence/damage-inducible protein A [Alphaproteobacteria bacterium]